MFVLFCVGVRLHGLTFTLINVSVLAIHRKSEALTLRGVAVNDMSFSPLAKPQIFKT